MASPLNNITLWTRGPGDQGVLGPTYVLSFGNPMHFFLSSDRASQCDNNTYVLHCINFPVVCNWIFKPIGCSSSDFICKKTIGICVKTSGVVIIFYCFFQAGASGEPQFIWCSFKNVKFDWLRKDTKSTMSCQSTLQSRFHKLLEWHKYVKILKRFKTWFPIQCKN